jgi:hypothetical protein
MNKDEIEFLAQLLMKSQMQLLYQHVQYTSKLCGSYQILHFGGYQLTIQSWTTSKAVFKHINREQGIYKMKYRRLCAHMYKHTFPWMANLTRSGLADR